MTNSGFNITKAHSDFGHTRNFLLFLLFLELIPEYNYKYDSDELTIVYMKGVFCD